MDGILPRIEPEPPAALVVYLRGWWAGALADAWPRVPVGLCPLLEARFSQGAFDGRLSRVAARSLRAVKGHPR